MFFACSLFFISSKNKELSKKHELTGVMKDELGKWVQKGDIIHAF